MLTVGVAAKSIKKPRSELRGFLFASAVLQEKAMAISNNIHGRQKCKPHAGMRTIPVHKVGSTITLRNVEAHLPGYEDGEKKLTDDGFDNGEAAGHDAYR